MKNEGLLRVATSSDEDGYKLEAGFDVQINWVAVNLPKLIKLSGNTPPALIKNKTLYSLRDLKRWAVLSRAYV